MSLSKYYSGSDKFRAEKLVQEAKGDYQFKPLGNARVAPTFSPTPLAEMVEKKNKEQHKESNTPEDSQSESSSVQESDFKPEDQLTIDSNFPSQTDFQNEGYQSVSLAQQQIAQSLQPVQPEIDLGQFIDIDQAKQQAETAYQQGVQHGIQEGLQLATQHKEEDYATAIDALNKACTQLNSIQDTLIRNSRGEMIDLALAIAERILRFSVTDQYTTVISTIEEALQKAIRSEEFTILLNPADYDAVAEKSQEFITNISGLENIVLKTSAEIEQGGVKLESPNCTIDATIASQFDSICSKIRSKNSYTEKTKK